VLPAWRASWGSASGRPGPWRAFEERDHHPRGLEDRVVDATPVQPRGKKIDQDIGILEH